MSLPCLSCSLDIPSQHGDRIWLQGLHLLTLGGPSCAMPQVSPMIRDISFFLVWSSSVTCCPRARLRPLCNTNPGTRLFSRTFPCEETPA